MMTDAQVLVVLTQQRLRASLPAQVAQVVCLDTDWETIAHGSKTNPVNEVTSENLAYVIYTSGSTGSCSLPISVVSVKWWKKADVTSGHLRHPLIANLLMSS